MTEQIKQIAERIKEIREISGISAETLAGQLGISTDSYLKYESGETDIPVGIIFEISELFNIELSVMLGGDNPKLRIYGLVRNGKGLKLERRKQYKYESRWATFLLQNTGRMFRIMDCILLLQTRDGQNQHEANCMDNGYQEVL